jgi:hypothetical protein
MSEDKSKKELDGAACSNEGQVETIENQRIVPRKRDNQISFENFLMFFPEVELPYSILSETQRMIEEEQEPLSATWMFNFVLGKDAVIDEFTEFMPCFSIASQHKIHILVYWEATLEGNAYKLATFSREGHLIDSRTIAGMRYESNSVIQSVCTITQSLTFSTVDGRLDSEGQPTDFSHETHEQRFCQVEADGQIVDL